MKTMFIILTLVLSISVYPTPYSTVDIVQWELWEHGVEQSEMNEKQNTLRSKLGSKWSEELDTALELIE